MPNAEESEFELPKDRVRPFTLFLFIRHNYYRLAIDTTIIRNWWKNLFYVIDSQVKKTQFEVIFFTKFVPELNDLFCNRSLTMYFLIYFLVKLIYYQNKDENNNTNAPFYVVAFTINKTS